MLSGTVMENQFEYKCNLLKEQWKSLCRVTLSAVCTEADAIQKGKGVFSKTGILVFKSVCDIFSLLAQLHVNKHIVYLSCFSGFLLIAAHSSCRKRFYRHF